MLNHLTPCLLRRIQDAHQITTEELTAEEHVLAILTHMEVKNSTYLIEMRIEQ